MRGFNVGVTVSLGDMELALDYINNEEHFMPDIEKYKIRRRKNGERCMEVTDKSDEEVKDIRESVGERLKGIPGLGYSVREDYRNNEDIENDSDIDEEYLDNSEDYFEDDFVDGADFKDEYTEEYEDEYIEEYGDEYIEEHEDEYEEFEDNWDEYMEDDGENEYIEDEHVEDGDNYFEDGKKEVEPLDNIEDTKEEFLESEIEVGNTARKADRRITMGSTIRVKTKASSKAEMKDNQEIQMNKKIQEMEQEIKRLKALSKSNIQKNNAGLQEGSMKDTDKYDSLDIDALYNEVKAYMNKMGVGRSLMNRKQLEDEFGQENVKRLLLKSYLITLGNRVTIGR